MNNPIQAVCQNPDCQQPIPPGDRGARGLCHRCYENWRYRNNPEQILAVNRRSYEKNKTKNKVTQAAWRAANKEKIRRDNREYREANRERLKAYHAEWKKDNRRKMRNSHLLRMFGITVEDFERMANAQGGVCAICRRPQRAKNKRNLCVDHDHTSGRVRGLLCSQCNKAIGLFGESPEVLSRAIDYLGGTDATPEQALKILEQATGPAVKMV
jgi:hypothetical protein